MAQLGISRSERPISDLCREDQVDLVVGSFPGFELVFVSQQQGPDLAGQGGFLDHLTGQSSRGWFAALDVAAWEITVIAFGVPADQTMTSMQDEASSDEFDVSGGGRGHGNNKG